MTILWIARMNAETMAKGGANKEAAACIQVDGTSSKNLSPIRNYSLLPMPGIVTCNCEIRTKRLPCTFLRKSWLEISAIWFACQLVRLLLELPFAFDCCIWQLLPLLQAILNYSLGYHFFYPLLSHLFWC